MLEEKEKLKQKELRQAEEMNNEKINAYVGSQIFKNNSNQVVGILSYHNLNLNAGGKEFTMCCLDKLIHTIRRKLNQGLLAVLEEREKLRQEELNQAG